MQRLRQMMDPEVQQQLLDGQGDAADDPAPGLRMSPRTRRRSSNFLS